MHIAMVPSLPSVGLVTAAGGVYGPVRPVMAPSITVPGVATARVISVNTGLGRDAQWAGRLKRTAIDKRPARGSVHVGRLGLSGDEQVDSDSHGGEDQAVYVYAREDLDWWVERLGRELPNGLAVSTVLCASFSARRCRPNDFADRSRSPILATE